MKNLKRIKEENPEALDNPLVQDILDQADKLQDLKALYDTSGGKQLVKLLITDAVSDIRKLRTVFQNATEIELRSIIAKLDASLTTAELLFNAEEGVNILDAQLEEALSE